MDYEKKYKEAIERLKQWDREHPDGYVISDRDEFIFPELAESKDEKIKRVIMNVITKVNYSELDGLIPDTIRIWLEKQCEQKGLDYPYVTGWRKNYKDNKPKVKHSVLMLTTHGIAEGEWLGEEWCQYRWSCKIKDEDVLYWLHLSDLENLEKENVEQKPAEDKPNFKVGDIIRHKKHGFTCKIIAIDTEYKLSDGLYLPFDFQDAYELVEQNPIECSEDNLPEFESYLCLMFQKFRTKGICTNGEIIDYVMEHAQKLKDTLCHDWSEEDERDFDVIYGIIYNSCNAEDASRLIAWLKSLKDRYTWKPSEKQIYSLDRALRFYGKGTAVYDSVKELLEQLKKLKE